MNSNNFASALNSTGKGAHKGRKGPANPTETLSSSGGDSSPNKDNSKLAEMLANPSLNKKDRSNNTNVEKSQADAQAKAQKEQLDQAEYEKQRLELHKKINPVDQKDVFDAREQATKRKIEKIRDELKVLAKEIKKFHKEIDIVLMGNVTNSGFEGIGDENFFEKLRAFIILMTQRVKSARTWATQMKNKKAKKGSKGKGLGKEMMGGGGHEQRSAMELFFNNERGDNMGE